MSAHPTADQIICSLNRSGYLMEQRVATELEALGFHVETNWAFEDPDEGKSRELDVRAVKRVAHNQAKKVDAFVEILAECKNTANPLVLITRSKNDRDRAEVSEESLFTFQYGMRKKLPSGDTQVRMVSPYQYLGIEQAHYDHHRDLKAVQFCQIYRDGKSWKAGHRGLYDGFFYPIAKAVQARKSEVLRMRTGGWRHLWFIVPMLVVSGPLYSINSMDADPKPEAVDSLGFKREVQSENLKGRFSVEFVRLEYVTEFVQECLRPLVDRATDLVSGDAELVLRKEVPWVD